MYFCTENIVNSFPCGRNVGFFKKVCIRNWDHCTYDVGMWRGLRYLRDAQHTPGAVVCRRTARHHVVQQPSGWCWAVPRNATGLSRRSKFSRLRTCCFSYGTTGLVRDTDTACGLYAMSALVAVELVTNASLKKLDKYRDDYRESHFFPKSQSGHELSILP